MESDAATSSGADAAGGMDFDFSHFDLRLAMELMVGLAIGLLIGLEREWRKRDSDNPARIGIRTFGLMGLLGGLAGALHQALGPWIVPATILALALLLISNRRREKTGIMLSEDMTTLVAALVTLLLGLLATVGAIELAVASAVVVVTLLYLKPTLHGLVSKLSETELRATVRFLVISLVILPVLPDQGYGPYEAFNPRSTWLLVVMISAMSFVGYFAIRALGAAMGVLATGLFGGMASSTATTITFAKLGSDKPAQGRMFAAGTILANAVMALRVLILTAVVAPALAMALALPLALAALVAIGFVAVIWYSARHEKLASDEMILSNPFELSQAIKFAALLTAIQIMARLMSDKFGELGLYALALLTGLADVDAITLSVARDVSGNADIGRGIIAILLAVAASLFIKCVIVMRSGGAFARWSVAALVIMLIAAGLGAGLQQAYL